VQCPFVVHEGLIPKELGPPDDGGAFDFRRHGTCFAQLRGANSEVSLALAILAPHFTRGRGVPVGQLSFQMFWSKFIRYAVLAGQIALAAGIAAIITMVLKYAIG
jgi:hypothetical protein